MRVFVPVYTDQFQAAQYTVVGWWFDGRSMWAIFEDGNTCISWFSSPEALLRAGDSDWRERAREI